MSVQFGKCNFDGKPVELQDLDRVRPVLTPYGPDGEGHFCKDNLGILIRTFHTTHESRSERQPYISASGLVVIWDGRLDNREELSDRLGREPSVGSADLAIVAAAYEQWGTDSFAHLIGDWTLSIWDARTRSLLLAKDFAGTRQLYYSVEEDQVTWCTILDPLVLFASRSLVIEDEYIAGCLAFFPASHLTPYAGIQSVPASSYVCLQKGNQRVSKYWDFDPAKAIRYGADADYEEHFRVVFAEAVRRRLRSDSPVLAELSGGMDSSSIVCVADDIFSRGQAEAPRLDTVSYYNDSEPNWNERPFFTRVEERRGRIGWHVDVAPQQQVTSDFDSVRFAAMPGADARPLEAFIRCVTSQGNRVLLSGIGGDEVTGGVPTPTPELADLLASGSVRALARQLKNWALNKRRPWFYLAFDAVRGFLPSAPLWTPKYKRPAPWLVRAFVRRNRAALQGYENRLKLLGPLPSFQENLSTLEALRRQLGCEALPIEPLHEKRYPYLDRDLLEFLYAVPRQQLVRPGQRRSLMRRALAGIVPAEILNRKRKAYVARSSFTDITARWEELIGLSEHLVLSSLGIVQQESFVKALQNARRGQELQIVILMRTLVIEAWLKRYRAWSASRGLHLPGECPLGQLSTEECTKSGHGRGERRQAFLPTCEIDLS